MVHWQCRGVLLAPVLAIVGACTTDSITPPINAFAQATQTAGASLNAYQAQLDKAIVDSAMDAAIAQPHSVTHPKGECVVGASRCRLYVRGANGLPLTAGAADHGIQELMTSVVAYSTNLAALANAGNAAEIRAAAKGANESILSLAKSHDQLAMAMGASTSGLTARISPYAGPVTDLVAYGLEKYSERVKLGEIRKAVANMETILPDVTIFFAETAHSAMQIKQNELLSAYEAATEAFESSGGDRRKLQVMVAAAEALDVSLTTKPEVTFIQLQKAHRALADALEGATSLRGVLRETEQLSAEAARLAAITDQIRAATQKS